MSHTAWLCYCINHCSKQPYKFKLSRTISLEYFPWNLSNMTENHYKSHPLLAPIKIKPKCIVKDFFQETIALELLFAWSLLQRQNTKGIKTNKNVCQENCLMNCLHWINIKVCHQWGKKILHVRLMLTYDAMAFCMSCPSGLAYQIQVLVLCRAECGFVSRYWHSVLEQDTQLLLLCPLDGT